MVSLMIFICLPLLWAFLTNMELTLYGSCQIFQLSQYQVQHIMVPSNHEFIFE